MAAIGTIRKHYGILIVIIGIALVAFILGDLFKSTNSRRTTDVAVVNNEKISQQDFANLVDVNLENYKRANGSISNEESVSIRNQVLEQMISEIIMNEEFEKLGITVSAEELYDQFLGKNPNQYVVQSFSDANGNFNRDALSQYLNDFQNLNDEAKVAWLNFERAIKDDRINTKYNTILEKSFYLPEKLAERYYENKNDKRSAEVYAVRYTTIQDSLVSLTDSDKKKFYEENKKKYETDAMRSIDYVVFEVNPSETDKQNAKEYVEGLMTELKNTTNVASLVNANSDRQYDSTWLSRKTVPVAVEAVVFDDNNEAGFVYGPYEDNGYYNILRIVDKSNRSDSLMASHLLVSYQGAFRSTETRTKEEAKALADSLFKVINKNPSKLEELAKDFSDDPTAVTNKGDLGWFSDGMMVTPFNEFVQNNKINAVGLVETDFGYHIVKVTDRTEKTPKVRLAIISHEISPSTATYQNVFAEANRLVTENQTMEQFNTAIEELGLNKRTFPSLRENTTRITGINNPREIIRWAFNKDTKVGDISSIFDLEDMYVIAVLTKSVEKGLPDYNDLIDRYEFMIKKTKKGEMLAEKAKAYGTDYQKMIDELGGEKTTIDNITFDGRAFGNFGVEDKIIGTVTALTEKDGFVGPLQGASALYVVKVDSYTPAEKTDNYDNILKERTSLYKNSILNGSPYRALRENAKIKDNSILFY